MRFYAVPLYSLVFCGFGAPPPCSRFACLMLYVLPHATFVYCECTFLGFEVYGTFWFSLCRRMPSYAVVCYRRDMPSSSLCPACAFALAIPWGILLMRYAMTCYNVLQRATGVFMGSRASMSSEDDALTLSLILLHIGERYFPSLRKKAVTAH